MSNKNGGRYFQKSNKSGSGFRSDNIVIKPDLSNNKQQTMQRPNQGNSSNAKPKSLMPESQRVKEEPKPIEVNIGKYTVTYTNILYILNCNRLSCVKVLLTIFK